MNCNVAGGKELLFSVLEANFVKCSDFDSVNRDDKRLLFDRMPVN